MALYNSYGPDCVIVDVVACHSFKFLLFKCIHGRLEGKKKIREEEIRLRRKTLD